MPRREFHLAILHLCECDHLQFDRLIFGLNLNLGPYDLPIEMQKWLKLWNNNPNIKNGILVLGSEILSQEALQNPRFFWSTFAGYL